MKITLKLYGGLEKYLPQNAKHNQAGIDVEDRYHVDQLLDYFGIPVDQRHLVMLNGVHIAPTDRAEQKLSELDSLAVWPPSTG